MRIEVQYVQKRGISGWRYRRKVPSHLREVLGKTEIVIPLGASEKEAIKNYSRAHAEAERQLAEATSGPKAKPLPPLNPDVGLVTPFELAQSAASEIRALKLDRNWTGGGDPDERDPEEISREVIAETIMSKYPVDANGYPIGVSAQDAALARILLSGARLPRPNPTLRDAERLYLKEKVKGRPNEKKKELETKRAIAFISDTLERDPELISISRQDAREIRDAMLDRVKPTSAERYMNTINAVINHAIKEFELDTVNRFAGLAITKETAAKDDRLPYTPDQLSKVRARVLNRGSDDLKRIWRILEGTGCRIAEVTGLMVADTVTEGNLPHINLVFHPHRRLKTEGSIRKVPLLGDALAAAKEAIEATGDDPLLFAAYCRDRGPDAASAALMKHVRACVTDKKVTVHSLRHTMADKLRTAGVSAADRELVLGHASGKIGDNYGGDDARLKVATQALKKALR
ncbi:tyrosine-type recombinase/integrase [Rhizobium leguminosarum]|uniref:tyrosine-type recombinase/integrase n=1 Tax=Rhizobium leguminosarum TaxID=384 RepID=UPI00036AE973|nr:tyrosine-type recombinase/integrase [Rhizobium leguminosarum]